ncbi:MAG: hypothetical protein ACLUNO_12050 [Oscillospiraceae bacterium]
MLETYETPYLVWANEAYAPDCDFDALALPETISLRPFGRGSVRADRYVGMDPYFDMLNAVRRSLPVINHDVYLDASGQTITRLTSEQEAQIKCLQWWKYYRLKDEALLEHCAG